MQGKRVVVTGMGTVNPLGNTVAETWASVLSGKSGIGAITRFDASRLSCRIAGEVKDFDYAPFFPEEMRKNAKRMDDFCHYAARRPRGGPTRRARLGPGQEPHRRVRLGTGIGGLNVQHENSVALATKGDRRVSPFYIPMSIGNMASGILSMLYGVTGPNLSLQTACATANHAIAMSQLIIKDGLADVMIAGGTEGVINELAVAAFSNMRALSTRNDSPETASRPYDVARDGFVMGEGSAILILEEYEHARRRGADSFSRSPPAACPGTLRLRGPRPGGPRRAFIDEDGSGEGWPERRRYRLHQHPRNLHAGGRHRGAQGRLGAGEDGS
jgi:3-oxoacyl-[acyl-carrier-protein] synthase II